jgi:transcriptional regulator with XRE-family HTH domain
MTHGGIGARIAVERRLRGFTQYQLADRAHVSMSLLRKVEQGGRPASTALVASVSKTLGIEQTRLTGQPYYATDQPVDALQDLIPDLRRELMMYGLPLQEEPAVPLEPAVLARRVAHCSLLLNDVNYVRLGRLLPGLLADLRACAGVHAGSVRCRLMTMLQESYDNAKRLAFDLGYPDLGVLAVSLEEQCAQETDDLLAVAVARAVRAWTLTRAGAYNSAYRLLVETADDLPGESPQRWSVWGFLHLQAALAAACSSDADRTWEHYAAACRAAARLGNDRNDYGLAFGPTNTAIWGVGLAVELQDGPTAVARAEQVVIPVGFPSARAGHHYLDLARAHIYNGDRQAALSALIAARRIAPQQTRYNPMARETVYALAKAERRSSEALRELAAWMGVLD